jgi:hypothetical protein
MAAQNAIRMISMKLGRLFTLTSPVKGGEQTSANVARDGKKSALAEAVTRMTEFQIYDHTII